MQSFPPVAEQLDELRRGVVEIVPEEELARKLEQSRRTGRPLRVKQGFDPTRPDLHIGHAVSIRKLRTFQELGHEVIFVVGDYTARVGDPTGRSETRPRLSPAEIDANARTYAEQAAMILDVERVRIEMNSKWLAPLDLAAVLELTATYTVARMLEREDFSKRYREGVPISLLEFMYPLLQAYDSVALRADVEVGGTDQKFNLLVGRTVQERFGQEPQVCVILPLMRGTDGVQKMSKSYDNYIGITEPPEEQFGKTMSIPDTLLREWIELAGGYSGEALAARVREAAENPYAAKRALAREIVRTYHGDDAAARAEAHFDRLFRDREEPDEMPDYTIDLADPAMRFESGSGVWLPALLVATGLAASNSEAGRLVEQGAIAVDGTIVSDRNARVPAQPGDFVTLRRGKRRFARVRFVQSDAVDRS
ncbi:MAG TPA: tyrosine--tRNA ligase [Longimicrobiales bacterium]|nr:tyrosine--tRNA ligase [Longimicrobiales bacterium]